MNCSLVIKNGGACILIMQAPPFFGVLEIGVLQYSLKAFVVLLCQM
jgi:hypothetical protein